MLKKRYYKFTERLMFAIVMRDEELCRELLERIIPERKIRRIRFPSDPAMDHLAAALMENRKEEFSVTVEKSIITGLYSKSVRFDDFLGEREPIYRFQMMEEKKHLPLGDGQFTIMVNMKCPEEDVPEELRTFYSFVNHGQVEESDSFICRIHNRVEQANQSREVFEIMTIADEFRMLEQYKVRLETAVEQMEGEKRQLETQQQLTKILIQQNRFDDLKKAMEEPVYQKKLMQELNLL